MDNIELWENIPKSPADKRNYRGLQLPNKMKVQLISDDKTEKAAVALTVRIGKTFRTTIMFPYQNKA